MIASPIATSKRAMIRGSTGLIPPDGVAAVSVPSTIPEGLTSMVGVNEIFGVGVLVGVDFFVGE